MSRLARDANLAVHRPRPRFRLRRVTGWEVRVVGHSSGEHGRRLWRRIYTLQCGHASAPDLPSAPIPKRRKCRECRDAG